MQALESAYLHAPGQVLAYALWKTRREPPSARHSFKARNGQVTELRLWDAKRLLLYWKPQANKMDFSGFDLAGFKLALLQQLAGKAKVCHRRR